jgi:hypothetical protein
VEGARVGAVLTGTLGAGGAGTNPHEVTPVPTPVQVQLSETRPDALRSVAVSPSLSQM